MARPAVRDSVRLFGLAVQLLIFSYLLEYMLVLRGLARKVGDQIPQLGDADDRDGQDLAQPVSAQESGAIVGKFLAIHAHKHPGNADPLLLQQRKQAANRRAGCQYIIDDYGSLATGEGSYQLSAFTMFLAFLAGEQAGKVQLVRAGQGHRQRGRYGGTFVGRTAQQVGRKTSLQIGVRVECSEARKIVTTGEGAKIEEIGALASRFELEFSEAEHLSLSEEVQKLIYFAHGSQFPLSVWSTLLAGCLQFA